MSGNLFIVAAPSGAGKTSLVNALVASHEDICLSVSHTTRPAREGELSGQHYHFVSQAEFDEMRDDGEFIESAMVFDYSYGTSGKAVEGLLADGFDVILEIDWQGAQQVRKRFADATSIFIIPPSKAALEERLRKRGQDDETIIQRRMRDAENEISHYVEFDYLIVNDEFEQALRMLTAIIVAKRHTLINQTESQALLIGDLLA